MAGLTRSPPSPPSRQAAGRDTPPLWATTACSAARCSCLPPFSALSTSASAAVGSSSTGASSSVTRPSSSSPSPPSPSYKGPLGSCGRASSSGMTRRRESSAGNYVGLIIIGIDKDNGNKQMGASFTL